MNNLSELQKKLKQINVLLLATAPPLEAGFFFGRPRPLLAAATFGDFAGGSSSPEDNGSSSSIGRLTGDLAGDATALVVPLGRPRPLLCPSPFDGDFTIGAKSNQENEIKF